MKLPDKLWHLYSIAASDATKRTAPHLNHASSKLSSRQRVSRCLSSSITSCHLCNVSSSSPNVKQRARARAIQVCASSGLTLNSCRTLAKSSPKTCMTASGMRNARGDRVTRATNHLAASSACASTAALEAPSCKLAFSHSALVQQQQSTRCELQLRSN